MIKYICPKCGGRVSHFVKTSIPPIYVYDCDKCDYHYEEGGEIKEVEAPLPRKSKVK